MLRIKTTPVDVIELFFVRFLFFVFSLYSIISSNSMLVHDHQWVNYTKWTQQNCNHFSVFSRSHCEHVSELKQFWASGLTFNKSNFQFYASNTNYIVDNILKHFIGSSQVSIQYKKKIGGQIRIFHHQKNSACGNERHLFRSQSV